MKTGLSPGTITRPGESLRLSQTTAIPAISAASPHGKAVTLQFSDNTLLPLLLGDHDRHMVRIEQALGVRLSCRGNRVAITGEASRVDAAQATLEGLWRRLERGESIGRPDVEAAIRLAEADTDPRLPLSDVPAIRTRRGAVGPRSPGQAAYIEALATHEMVFGIGPAGTGQDLSRGGPGGGDAAGRQGGSHRAVSPGRRGWRTAGLPAR